MHFGARGALLGALRLQREQPGTHPRAAALFLSCSFNKHELGALRAGGLPAGANGKEPVCQGRAVRDLG